MRFLLIFVMAFGFILPGSLSEDCQEFKKQCQDVCINKSVDIWANECWGDPLYVECKCSDESVHKIPGFTCKNSECPPEFKQKPIPNRTRTRVRGKPNSPTAAPDCDSFKEECKNSCLNKSVDIHVNECWGSPLYVDCKCSDGTNIKIPGFTCKSSECPVDDSKFIKRNPGVNRRRIQPTNN